MHGHRIDILFEKKVPVANHQVSPVQGFFVLSTPPKTNMEAVKGSLEKEQNGKNLLKHLSTNFCGFHLSFQGHIKSIHCI